MLDITKMLHQIIDLELKIDDEKELMIGPETRKQTIFVDLDISYYCFNFGCVGNW